GAPTRLDAPEIGKPARDFERETWTGLTRRGVDCPANPKPQRAGIEHGLLDAGGVGQPATASRAEDIGRCRRVEAARAEGERTRYFASQRHALVCAKAAG